MMRNMLTQSHLRLAMLSKPSVRRLPQGGSPVKSAVYIAQSALQAAVTVTVTPAQTDICNGIAHKLQPLDPEDVVGDKHVKF